MSDKRNRDQGDNTTREESTSSHPAQTLVLTSLFDRMTIMNLVKFFSAHIIGNVAASNKIMNFQLDTPMAWKLRCVRYIKVPAVKVPLNIVNISLNEWKQLAHSISRYKFVGFSTPMPLARLQKIASASQEIESSDERNTEFCVQLNSINRSLNECWSEDSVTIATHRAEEFIEFDGDKFELYIEVQLQFQDDYYEHPDWFEDDEKRKLAEKSNIFWVEWNCEGDSTGKSPPYDGFEGLGPTKTSPHDSRKEAWTALEYQAHYLVSSQQSPIADSSHHTVFGYPPEANSAGSGRGSRTPQNLVAALEQATPAAPVIIFFRIRSFRSEPSVLRPVIIAGRSTRSWTDKWENLEEDNSS